MKRLLNPLMFAAPLAIGLCGISKADVDPENVEVVVVEQGKLLVWQGQPGRTYFVQTSDPNEAPAGTLLESWLWMPDFIDHGSGVPIQHEIVTTADKAFFRIWHTDDQPPQGVSLEDWDADGDGLSNYAETTTHQTNPLIPDTDDDGLPDGWEVNNGLDPNDASGDNGGLGDPDHDGRNNLQEYQQSTNPTQADEPPALETTFELRMSRLNLGYVYVYPDWALVYAGDARWADGTEVPYLTLFQEGQNGTFQNYAGASGYVPAPSTFDPEVGWEEHAEPPPIERFSRYWWHSSGVVYEARATSAELRLKSNLPAPAGGISRQVDYLLCTFAIAADATETPVSITHLSHVFTIPEGQTTCPPWALSSNPALPDATTVRLLPVGLNADWNRDGRIDSADKGRVTVENPWRWWLNDDFDVRWATIDGEVVLADRGDDTNDVPAHPFPNCDNLEIDGIRDLIDFFPLHLDLAEVLNVLPANDYRYLLKHEQGALKYYEFPECIIDGSDGQLAPNRHVKLVSVGHALSGQSLTLASAQGTDLSPGFLASAAAGQGVVLIEGAQITDKPLTLEIIRKADDASMAQIEMPMRITDVEKMYRHVNYRDIMGGSGGNPTVTDERPDFPDDLTNGKYVAYVHGYNVGADSARGSQSDIFKRLHQLGSKARYIAVTWYGDPPAPFPSVGKPPDYHQAVYNGLVTGVLARARLGFTQDADLTILAHSLGNSLVGAAIAHHSLQVDQYYIINGAIPLQAYDPDQTDNSSQPSNMKRNMTEDDWKPYYDYGQQRLFAANWHELFADNPLDQRNKLTWKGFLAEPELLGVAYNFYSPSDEVVENADETEEFGDWGNLWNSAFGGGRHAWVQQEIGKGGQDPLAESFFHELNGGWEAHFNPNGEPSDPWMRGYYKVEGAGFRMYEPAEAAAEISAEDLRLKPFHRPFLFLDLYDPEVGSTTAGVTPNRYKLLGTAIPATSYAIAANAVEEFDEYGERNFNMPAEMKSPEGAAMWPEDENAESPGDWLHSDFNEVALQFVYPMYERMIDLAELDEE